MTRYICPDCIGEKTLSNRLIKLRPGFDDTEKCEFHPNKKGIPVKVVAEIVDEVFRNNFGWGEFRSSPRMEDDRVDHVQEGETLDFVLGEIIEADIDVVLAVKEALFQQDDHDPREGEHGFYADDQSYVEIRNDGHAFSMNWELFREAIQHEQRFFNDAARDRLFHIFEGVHRLAGANKSRAIYIAGPGKKLNRVYRVRRADSRDDQEKILKAPWAELGAPPERSRKPGRMNPSGIAGLYCALELETCVAEMRPPVGCHLVGTAFDIIRPICVLDMTKFKGSQQAMSIFRPRYTEARGQWAFMQSFRHDISQPVLPDDEHLDYVPTQVVAEYLAHHHEVVVGGETRKIDAILYSSAQRPGGTNIVLLGNAATVEKPDQGEVDEISDGRSDFDHPSKFSRRERQKETLQIVEDSLKVIRINSAEFGAEAFAQTISYSGY